MQGYISHYADIKVSVEDVFRGMKVLIGVPVDAYVSDNKILVNTINEEFKPTKVLVSVDEEKVNILKNIISLENSFKEAGLMDKMLG